MSAWAILPGVVAALAAAGWGLGFATAAVVTLVGVTLCWRAPMRRMAIEERAKDRVLTRAQARRTLRFTAWYGRVLTLVGCALLVASIWR